MGDHRAQCWAFSQKRKKWQEVFCHLGDLHSMDGGKIGVTYSRDPNAKEYMMNKSSVSATMPKELEEAQSQVGLEHNFFLQAAYYSAIKDGSKTWEGRLNDMKCKSIKVGDFLIFNKKLKKEVLQRIEFESFSKMLDEIGLQTMLPGCGSIHDGVEIYRGFPHYRNMESTHGCVAFRLGDVEESSTANNRKRVQTETPERQQLAQPARAKRRLEVEAQEEAAEAEEEADEVDEEAEPRAVLEEDSDSDDDKPLALRFP